MKDLVITTHSKPDGLGRVCFSMDWFDDYCPHLEGPGRRGQVFHARPEDYKDDFESAVKIIDEIKA